MIFEYPPDLPITEKITELAEVIKKSSVVIVSGDTGSGKSTQLPKLCMQYGLGGNKPIAHTQPRRIAATALASRISSECQTALGDGVGYKIRFSSQVSSQTQLILMTDGILLAELEQDYLLRRYDLIIVDEAHERSLNIDFLLGCLKNILLKRRDLKIIITSATLDIERFSKFFNNAPKVHIEGRTYPVETRYKPLALENSREALSLSEGILEAVISLQAEARQGGGFGDILVFLPTERDIHEVEEVLEKAKLFNTEILLLFARLSSQAQQKIFQSSTKRRIILSTNVAETSITVPNIFYVIDSGLARIKKYNPRSKVERLPIESISQASANQRMGRCGRIAPGICIRLYSREDFLSRDLFTEPEILRSNLAAVILKMKVLKLGSIETFPFLERPENNLIKDGFLLLEELGALVSAGGEIGRGAINCAPTLTNIGWEIAKYPVDPRLGRILVAAKINKVLEYILIIVAGLAVQDPRVRPMESQTKADQAHKKFKHINSDFLSFVILFDCINQAKKDLSNKAFSQYLQENFISPIRYREWLSVYQELKNSLGEVNKEIKLSEPDFENLDKKSLLIHRSLLTGLLGHIGHLDLLEKPAGLRYEGARGIHFQLFPGSVFGKKTPAWVMGYELVETTKVFARVVSEINPDEIERAAPHLIKRQYFEPHWIRTGFVGAFEKISLYGLEIIPKRRVNLSNLDIKTSREFFIRGAFVEQETDEKLDFLLANKKLKDELLEFEHQQRTSGLLIGDEVYFEFFNKLIPEDMADMIKFKKFYQSLNLLDQKAFFYTKDFLLAYTPSETLAYPASLKFKSIELLLSYHFEPGAIDDGVSLEIPVASLNQIDLAKTSYLVLPLLVERIEALIKTLPKSKRLACSPPMTYAQVLFDLIKDKKPDLAGLDLLDFISQELSRLTHIKINLEDFREKDISPHLRMNYRLRDLNNQILKESKDFVSLQISFQEKAETAVKSLHGFAEREGMITWDFGYLPESVESEKDGMKYVAYPALLDTGESVKLHLVSSLKIAEQQSLEGILRLIKLALPREIQVLKRKISGIEIFILNNKNLKNQGEDYLEEFVSFVLVGVFSLEKLPRTEQDFLERINKFKNKLIETATQKLVLFNEIFKLYQSCQTAVSSARLTKPILEDIRTQLDYLIYPGFIRHTPVNWLSRYPVYFKAILNRLEKYQADKDVLAMKELDKVWGLYLKEESLPLTSEIHYLIEELRISLFAQHLKTCQPVSVKRILESW